MVTTRGQTVRPTDNGKPSTGALADKVVKATAPIKPKAIAPKKAPLVKKAASGKKCQTKAAAVPKRPPDLVVNDAGYPSPVNSIGTQLTTHPIRDHTSLTLARQGPSYRAATTDPIGLLNRNNECYSNVSIIALLNLTPFVGFLEQHGSTPRCYGDGELPEQDILARLNDIAMEYWSADDSGKQGRVDALATHFKNWLVDAAGDYHGTNIWDPRVGTQEDASECLDKILEIASTQLSTFDVNGANSLEAIVQPSFQQRWACVGTGKTCIIDQRVRIPGKHDGFLQRLLILDLPPFVPGAKSLQDCIGHFMNNKTNMRTCNHCRNLYKPTNPKGLDGVGREWNRIREAPECLLVKLDRIKLKGPKAWKVMENVRIPDMVDLTEYLEADDQAAGIEARYRLDVLIYHGGTGAKSGHYIAHVRNHADPNRWHCLNDQRKSDECFAEAVDDTSRFGRSKFTAYMLGFVKIHDSLEDKKTAGGTRTDCSKGAGSVDTGVKAGDIPTDGSKHNSSMEAAYKHNDFNDAKSKSSTGKTGQSFQAPGMGLATFTAVLYPTGGSKKPFETVTQNIKLDSSFRTTDRIPIEVRLALPDGNKLTLKKLKGKERQYFLAARADGKKCHESRASSKASKVPNEPSIKDPKSHVSKRRLSENNRKVRYNPKRVKAV